MRAENFTRGTMLGDTVVVADTLPARLAGLMGKKGFAPGSGLLLVPCMGIHTAFVRFPIDALFLDRENRVIAREDSMPPFRVSPVHLKAKAVLELPAGTAEASGTEIGDMIRFA